MSTSLIVWAAGIFTITSVIVIVALYSLYSKVTWSSIFSNRIGINKYISGVTSIKGVNIDNSNRELMLGGIVGAVIGVLLLWGSEYTISGALLLGAFGVSLVFVIRKLSAAKYEDARRREVRILFESVEILMLAGTPIQKALMKSSELLNHLKPAVNNSLMYWPDVASMIEALRREINLPEGDILVSLLAQINNVGAERFEGIIQKETQRLEEMTEAAIKVRTDRKPYLLIVSRALPVLVILGMFVGALFIRMQESLPF